MKLGVRGLLVTLGLAIVGILASACDTGGLSPIFPQPVSPNGQNIYNLYELISIPAILIFVGTEAALLWVVLKYRKSVQPAGYKPPQIHGNNKVEVVWTILPLIVVMGIASLSFAELQNDFQPVSNQDMTIIVSGHQFGWSYDYGQGVVVNQEGSLNTPVTPFVVPTGKLIKLQFRGTDVIHSWWVPAISGKTDAVPGYDNFSWLKIDQAGEYRGECAELCGTGHATMQIIVQAMSPSDYDAWFAQQLAAANATPTPAESPSPSASPSPIAVSPSPSPSPS